jgi:hypothetical protein
VSSSISNTLANPVIALSTALRFTTGGGNNLKFSNGNQILNRKQTSYVFWLSLTVATVAFFVSPLRGHVCISQFRLSNESEQIEAALDYYVASLSNDVEFQDPHKPKTRRLINPKFTTKENFKSRFPNCCKLVPDSESLVGESGWEAWLTGGVAKQVMIEFTVPYLGDLGEQREIAHQQTIPVSTCDTVRWDVFYTSIGAVDWRKVKFE